MSTRLGTVSVGAQTDRETADFLREEANRLGVSRSELLRRLVDHYEESRAGELHCPDCGRQLPIEL